MRQNYYNIYKRHDESYIFIHLILCNLWSYKHTHTNANESEIVLSYVLIDYDVKNIVLIKQLIILN